MRAGLLPAALRLPHAPGLDWPRGSARAAAPTGPERDRLLHYERLMGLAHLTVVPVAVAASVVQRAAVRPSLGAGATLVTITLCYAVAYHFALPRRWLSHAKVVLGLCLDTLLCTVVVHLTGDHVSLLVFLYYLIVIITALALRSRAVLGICALTSGAFCTLLPVDPLVRADPGAQLGEVAVFIASVWLVGAVAAAGAVQIQNAERRLVLSLRDQRAISARNASLTADLSTQLAASTALAASLAHEREQTRQLADMVIRAQEEERRRVARELHDEANQTLAALITTVDMAEAQAQRRHDSELTTTIARLRRLAATALADLQGLALELRPPALDEFGLLPALTRHVAERTRGSRLRADVGSEGRRRRLSSSVEVALYRIAQEALANVQKHSGATQVQLRLRFREHAVRLDVSDDGVGFEPSTSMADAEPQGVAAGRARLGLAGMRERAAIVGGTLEVSSRPGGGTRVSAQIPLDGADSGAPR